MVAMLDTLPPCFSGGVGILAGVAVVITFNFLIYVVQEKF